MISIWETLDRAETGPFCSEHDFNLNFLSSKIEELVANYNIELNTDEIVPLDPSLSDDVWNASLDLIREVDMYCTSTKRRIVLSEEELKEMLTTIPGKYSMKKFK